MEATLVAGILVAGVSGPWRRNESLFTMPVMSAPRV